MATLTNMSSEIQGFYNLPLEDRMKFVTQFANLTEDDVRTLKDSGNSFDTKQADKMIENVVGIYPLPMGIATYFRINHRDYLIPMVTEEASVVAAASYGAKLARPSGGFTGTATDPIMIAQIQLVGSRNWEEAKTKVLQRKEHLIQLANRVYPSLQNRGGGAKDLEVRIIATQRGEQMIIHLLVDVRDSMGANSITRMAELLTPELEMLTESKARLRILSNLAIHRVFKVEATWKKEDLECSAKGCKMNGEEIIEAFLDAWAFGDADPFRAATNNKGIMNGIDAVVLATGNDFRAVESSAHAFAGYNKKTYSTLSYYEKTPEGHLRGILEIPLAIGTAGGVTQVHPTAKLAMKILNVSNSDELGIVMASVGLAQNFAAIRALVTEGILRGHLRLHARNIATLAGAKGTLVDTVAHIMTFENNFSVERAKQLIQEYCFVM